MEAETLLLDCGYTPVARVPWQRAVTLWFEGKVQVVEEHSAVVRSVTIELKVPSVVRFVRAIRGKKRAVKFSREAIWARDKGRCQYCGTPVQRSEFEYEHVVPRAQGGKTEWGNIVVACTGCNQRKGGRTPQQAGMQLRSVPVKPRSLPDSVRFCLTYQEGMPLAWKAWLRDVRYWNGELESD